MPDDPFLTKLRGGAPAAEDPFLAKVRGGGNDPFLAKIRAPEPAPLAQPAKHRFGFYPATPEETARATAPLDNPPAGVTPPVERMKREWNAYDQEVGGAAKSADDAMGNLARGEILHDPVGTVRDVGRVAGAVFAPVTALANRVLQPGGSETERKIMWGLRTPLDAPGAAIHDLSPALGEKGAEALVSGAMLAAPFVKGLAKGGLESIRRIGKGAAPDISKPPAFDIPEARVEPALPQAMPERPAPTPSLRAGDRPIPPAELAALGDKAWEGVEPAPSPAKPAEAPPSPPPASGQVPAAPSAPVRDLAPERGGTGAPRGYDANVNEAMQIANRIVGSGDRAPRQSSDIVRDLADSPHLSPATKNALQSVVALTQESRGAPTRMNAGEIAGHGDRQAAGQYTQGYIELSGPAIERSISKQLAKGRSHEAAAHRALATLVAHEHVHSMTSDVLKFVEDVAESTQARQWSVERPRDTAILDARDMAGSGYRTAESAVSGVVKVLNEFRRQRGGLGANDPATNYAAWKPGEFVAEALSNPKVQEALAKMKSLGRSGGTLWTDMKAALARILEHFGVRDARTLLDDAMEAVQDLKSAQSDLQSRGAIDPSRVPAYAPDVPAAPPREGPTLGVGLGALGTKPEGWIEAIEKPYERTIGKGVAKVVDPALNLFKSPEAKISPEFEKAVQEGRATERGLSAEAKRAVKQFERGTKGVTPEQNRQIGRSLSSEDADLSGLTPEQRAAVEEFRGKAESVRAQEVKAGTLSPEAQAEYGQGHLKRVVKPGMIAERRVARAGGVTIKAYQTAKDMFGIKVDLPAEEVRALVPPDSPLRYLKQEGRSTLLKFTNSPEGMKARDAFYENVKSRFADARSKLSADTTREIKAGDVGQAKQFAKAQADVPRVGDLGVEKFDPIPEDVADRIFVKDTAQRAHVTLQESARRIGKAETLKNIADVVDSKGPVAIEPDGPRAETPEGYTLVDNKNFGPLHRKFVRNDVLEYVKGAFEPQQKHFLTELGDGLMERFKTVRLLDPRMVPRQAISNMEFENLMGMSNWNPRYLQWKAKGLAAMREGSPYRAALERNGFLQSGVVTEAEIGLAENALAEGGSVGKRIGRAIGSLGLTELAPGALKRAESVGWKAYSYMDAWTKATGYVHAIEELGMSPADAAAYVRKWTPSPESVATWVQGYSKHLVGDPWARYRAEMARINLQALKEKPIRLSMNRLQKNLIRGAAIAAGASLLSDDEEKALKNEQGGGAVALGRDEQGRPLALNYTFLSTLGDFFSQPKTVGKPWDDAKETFLRWSGLGDNPLYSTGSQLLTGENARTGKPINPEGTVEGGLKSFLALAASQWTPSMLSTHLNKLQAAWNDEAYSPNQPKQTKEQAILDVFFGLKLTPLDAQQALQKITRQGGRAYDDIATMFRGQALRGEAIDPEKARDLANMLAKDYSERAAPLNRIATEQAKRKIGAGK